MPAPPIYFVQIHLSDGRWVPYGPTFRSTAAAEIWAKRTLHGQDYVVTTAGEDKNDLDDAT